jgi:hypothetical protein
MAFYLVSLGGDTCGSSEPRYFWMRDGGDRWIHFVEGCWPFKNESDIIAEVVMTQDVTDLDWSRTPLFDSDSSAGWLSRQGRFYGCPEKYHDKFAAYVLGMKVHELESTGWARVLDSSSYAATQNLSPEQNSWLAHKGYKVYERW